MQTFEKTPRVPRAELAGLLLISWCGASLLPGQTPSNTPNFDFEWADAVTGDNSFTEGGETHWYVDPGADQYAIDQWERPTNQSYKYWSGAGMYGTASDYFGIDYPSWTSASEKDRQSYTLSAMLAVYFLAELDNQGRNLRSYVSALTSGKDAGDALTEALNGRSLDEFSAAMKTALSRQGLTIRG